MRKDRLAPYEVMARSRPESDGGGEPVPADEAVEAVRVPHSRGPLVVRIPPGYAVLVAVLLVGVVVLAYWVGYTRGDRDHGERIRREQELQIRLQEQAVLEGRPALIDPGAASGPAAPAEGPGRTQSPVIGTRDPRTSGLNYFVLIHYPPEDAERLVAFLRANGVDAAAVGSNNRRLFKVVALRGFTAEELDAEARRQYEQKLRQLGRQWKTTRQGAGDLSDMYPELYRGS